MNAVYSLYYYLLLYMILYKLIINAISFFLYKFIATHHMMHLFKLINFFINYMNLGSIIYQLDNQKEFLIPFIFLIK